MTLTPSDNFFIVAHRLLEEKNKKWHVRDFAKELINPEKAGAFFKVLEREDILERPIHSGRSSFTILRSPKKLLRFCTEIYPQNELKTVSFVTHKNLKETVSGLESLGYEIFRGGINGIPLRYQSVVQNRMDLLCLTPSFFSRKGYQKILYDQDIHRVFEGGNLFITHPRFKKWLRSRFVLDEDMKIPSDLYSILSLKKSRNPMASAALEYFLKATKREGGLLAETL